MDYDRHRDNRPMLAVVAALGMLLVVLALLLFVDFDENTTPIVVTVVLAIATTVPSVLAAAFAERAARDIRNGVLEGKAREGARQAIEERDLHRDTQRAGDAARRAAATDDKL